MCVCVCVCVSAQVRFPTGFPAHLIQEFSVTFKVMFVDVYQRLNASVGVKI